MPYLLTKKRLNIYPKSHWKYLSHSLCYYNCRLHRRRQHVRTNSFEPKFQMPTDLQPGKLYNCFKFDKVIDQGNM